MSKLKLVYNNLQYKKVFRVGKSLFKCTVKDNPNFLFGFCGLKLSESGYLSFKELETIRRVISRYSKRKCKVWFRVSSSVPITVKPKSSRMGKGVGKFSHSLFFFKQGRILLELSYVNFKLASSLLIFSSKKLSLKTSMIFRIKNNNISKYV